MKRLLSALRRSHRDERGITGLETAIILIAFVVVATVFAFVVLTTGVFSSERGKESVFAGLQKARGTLELRGGGVISSSGCPGAPGRRARCHPPVARLAVCGHATALVATKLGAALADLGRNGSALRSTRAPGPRGRQLQELPSSHLRPPACLGSATDAQRSPTSRGLPQNKGGPLG